jgi:hypothetical protein
MDQVPEQKMVIPGGGRFRLGQLALALAGGLAAGVALAWLAAQVQQLRAPWLVFPLATGLVLGATLVGWVRLAQVGHRPTLVAVTLLAAATLIVGQHYFSFRVILQTTQQKSPAMEKTRLLFAGSSWEESPLAPLRFGPFLRWQAARGRRIGRFVARGGLAWASWALDGVLLATAALAVVGSSIGRPYCNHCRSWFRPTRRGRLDPDRAAEVVHRIGRSPPEPASAADYRMLTCNGGCGPTGMDLRWLGNPAAGDRYWLDATARGKVWEVLDQAKGNASE